MSLYGNVKKIGSSYFQFDRIYPNRKSMDYATDEEGNFLLDEHGHLIPNNDGVYAGRYVLVDYGERFRNVTTLEDIDAALSELEANFQSIVDQDAKWDNWWESYIQNYPEIFGEDAPISAQDFISKTYLEQRNFLVNLKNIYSGDETIIQNAIDELDLYTRNSVTPEQKWGEFFQRYQSIFGINTPAEQRIFQHKAYLKQVEYLNELKNALMNNTSQPRLSDTSSPVPGSSIEYLGQPNIYQNTLTHQKVKENEAFLHNEQIDLQQYGAIYDSTVWQKIYIQNQDRYIMIAELNAIAPKLDVENHAPYTYEIVPPNTTDGVISGRFDEETKEFEIVKLINAKEKYQPAYFDTTMDTELRYLMHYPDSVQLEAGNNDINFNKNGFDAVYSYGEVEGPSTIALIPKGLDNYTKQMTTDKDGQIVYSTDPNGHILATLNKNNMTADTKTLFMNFPAIGNAMNTIYNLLYGIPDDDPEELKHGALRPYFKQFLRDQEFVNILKTYNENNQLVPVTINDKTINVKGTLETYNDQTGEWEITSTIPHFTWDEVFNKTIEPHRTVEARYQESENSEPIELPSTMPNHGFCILWNKFLNRPISHSMHAPYGDEQPDADLLKKIPTIEQLIKTNAAGLATVLQNLFGIKDPLTGLVRYYLYNDWTASSNGDTNTPMILNKPYSVGGWQDNYINVPAGASDPSYYETPGQLAKLTNDGLVIEGEVVHYPHTEIKRVKDEDGNDVFSGGHYQIDFDTWQLMAM